MRALLSLLFIPTVFIAKGLVMRCAWNWAASPVFHLRHCTLLEALAVSVVVATQQYVPDDKRTLEDLYFVLFFKYGLILIAAASVGAWAQ